MMERTQSRFDRPAHLVANINRARRIIPYKHYGEARRRATLHEIYDGIAQLGLKLPSCGSTIDHQCTHYVSDPIKRFIARPPCDRRSAGYDFPRGT